MHDNVFFSIIVPVYNVENYLEECINSILCQTYKNYEILLIDDGSTDKSGIICDDFSKKHKQIKTIHKKNGGLSDARNVGFNNCNGEYIIFVDSDDYWICNDFLKKMNDKITKNCCDIIIFNLKKYFPNGSYSTPRFFIKNLNENQYVSKKILIKENIYKACACDKVIKKSILIENNIHFPLNRFSEDIEWSAKLLNVLNEKFIYVTNQVFYIYRQRGNSISHSVEIRNIRDIYEMIANNYIEKDNKEDIINSYLAYEYAVLLGLINFRKFKDNNLEFKKEIYKLSKILDYDLSYKVKAVRILSKILGIKITSKILGFFINLKNHKRR